jgi:shikimate kinase
MNIYLIGYMGSGKTTLGLELAKLLDYDFADLDHYVEVKHGFPIPIIFEQYGEETFRLWESETLHEISKQIYTVAATGGGAPCFYHNMDLMNATGTTLYLKLTPEQIYSRLKVQKEDRPLIRRLTNLELKNFIISSLEKREKYYLKAHYIVKANNISAKDLCRLIKT